MCYDMEILVASGAARIPMGAACGRRLQFACLVLCLLLGKLNVYGKTGFPKFLITKYCSIWQRHNACSGF